MQTNRNFSVSAPGPDGILQELRFDDYLPEGDEREDIKSSAHEALKKMIEKPTDYRGHVEKARQFLRVLWKKYDCENVVEIFDAFTRVEPVLIDMEESEGVGFRYRDHSVHTFHVFTFGLRVISKLINTVGDEQAQELLKIKPEKICRFIPAFRDYDYKERLLYLWSLMSTFHDIAVPLEHLDIIRDGLNQFSRQFDLTIEGPYLQDIMAADIEEYFSLLSRIFQGGVKFVDEGVCYKQDEENLYVKNILAREFKKKNHGVLGGFMMYNIIKKTFLLGLSKHKLDMNSFNNYVKFVLSQDVARAALAISLHNLKRDPSTNEGPLFLPLSFDKYPLTFILILSDGLQEYLRWEGTTIRGATMISRFPAVELKVNSSIVELEVTYYLGEDSFQKKIFMKQAESRAKLLSTSPPQNIGDAASILCNALTEELRKQINLRDNFVLYLNIKQNGKDLIRRRVQ